MKSTSAVFVVWSMTAVISPVFANCPQEQDAPPCRAGKRIVLAQNDDTPTASASQKQVNTYQEQRLSQPDGLGFGLLIAGLRGIHVFYDHTVDVSSQLHAQLGYKVGSPRVMFLQSSVDLVQPRNGS